MSPTEATATSTLGAQSGDTGRSISPTAIMRMFSEMLRVRAERRRLMALDDRMLKDIGLSRSDAFSEAARSPFDLPSRRPSTFF